MAMADGQTRGCRVAAGGREEDEEAKGSQGGETYTPWEETVVPVR
jgi:hypothetical protein